MAMTDTFTAAPTSAAPEYLGPPRRDWRTAFAAMRRLIADKEDTGQVYDIMKALNGDAYAKAYVRLLDTPTGGRVAYERRELEAMLMDDAWLDSFADGTVGAAYRHFVRSENISAKGLADIGRAKQGSDEDIAHPYAWFGRRIRDTHDIWHILSGYHRDGLGEACLVAFSYAQTRALGWGFIGAIAAFRVWRSGSTRAAKAIWQGYKRGKAAKWLSGEDYVQLFNEPLDGARKRLNITPATIYNQLAAETVLT
jgi:ubiquinone biosynthesis protein COQ4